MDTPTPTLPSRPSGLLAAALLGLALLATGPTAQAQGANLRLPAAMGTTAVSPSWGTGLLVPDSALSGADYRLLPADPAPASWWPRISVGLQQRTLLSGWRPLGLERSGDADVVLGATSMFFGQSLQLHGALRNTTAMLPSALGRGERQWQPEIGLAYLLRGDLAIGAEYRFRPGASAGMGAADDTARDIYLAWAPRRDLSLSFGWADQGRSAGTGLTPRRSLTGFYVAGQVAF